jgi:hypothetical protein
MGWLVTFAAALMRVVRFVAIVSRRARWPEAAAKSNRDNGAFPTSSVENSYSKHSLLRSNRSDFDIAKLVTARHSFAKHYEPVSY